MNETKFDGMGKIYDKFRPTYPQTFIKYLRSDVGVCKKSTVADIGSGTGILTRQLLEICKNVIAVEPNSDMRVVAEKNLNNFVNFTSVNGTAENTTLGSKSVDFITVAQAFHWFDRMKFKAECNRILIPKGKVILVWNRRDDNAEFYRMLYRDSRLATRQQLHTLVDMLEENGLETMYNVMIRFIPEVEPLPDEIESHVLAMEEFKRGEVVSPDEIDWS